MLRDRPTYQQPGFGPSPSNSPTSSTASKCQAVRHGIKQKKLCCCCCYCSPSSSSYVTSIGVFILVLTYTALGALTFMALEGGFTNLKPLEIIEKSLDKAGEPGDKRQKLATNEEIRLQTVEKLWSITEDLNILYKENWTRLATQEVLKFQESLVKTFKNYGGTITIRPGVGSNEGAAVYYAHHLHRWSFASSFLYSLTVITTIGYGSIAPRTPWGKLTSILYAIIGIPLMLIYLSTTGEILSRYFRSLYAKMLCANGNKSRGERKSRQKKCKKEATILNAAYGPKHNVGLADGKVPLPEGCTTPEDPSKGKSGAYVCPHHVTVRVPISLCLLIILLYVCGGAYLFHCVENWTYLESSFFCFASLSTIGFGDTIPGLRHNANPSKKSSANGEIISVAISSGYILIGMAVIAMCFNLVQEQAVVTLRRMTKFLGVISDGREEKDELEGISMSIVSSTAS